MTVTIRGDVGREGSNLVREMEDLLAIELREELLKTMKDAARSVLARMRTCRQCGKLFAVKRNGHRAKRCPACR